MPTGDPYLTRTLAALTRRSKALRHRRVTFERCGVGAEECIEVRANGVLVRVGARAAVRVDVVDARRTVLRVEGLIVPDPSRIVAALEATLDQGMGRTPTAVQLAAVERLWRGIGLRAAA